MRTLTLATALIVALAASAPAASALRLIVPGGRIGPVGLGDSEAMVARVLGQPAQREATADGRWMTWPRDGLEAWFRGGRVVRIMVRGNPAYRTAEGIGVGADRERVLAAYGGAYQAEEDAESLIISFRIGIAFALDRGGRVTAVLVFPAR